MKKSDWIFLSSVLLYSILFWKQMPGINFLIFTVALLAGQALLKPQILKTRSWLLAAAGALCSAACVMYLSTALSIFATFFLLLISSYFAFNQKGSILSGILSTFISIIASIGFMIVRLVERKKERGENQETNRSWKKFVIVLVALLVVLVFFMMYRDSSLLFYQLTQKINFDWISFGWICFTFFGALVVYGFYYHNSIPGFAEWDANKEMKLKEGAEPRLLDKLMGMDNERFSGIVLLSLLNIMLLIVNALDLAFILGGDGKLPQGVSCMQYVHQGVGTLIVSIIFAMLIILYYFRGRMNFGNGKILGILAFAWIAQNAFMLFSTAWRNEVYVLVFGLTYKRIGVYVYLLLALIGLTVTAWKVQGKKTNAFLVRMNSGLFTGVWVIACFINWDGLIIHFNAQNKIKPDLVYLNSLTSNILPEIVDYSLKHPEEVKAAELENEIPRRVYLFLSNQKFRRENNKWPSYVLKSDMNYNSLKDQPAFGESQQLNVNGQELKKIYYFNGFKNITDINASANDLTETGEAGKFSNLGAINLADNPKLISLEGIEKCPKLQYLELNGTPVTDYSPLLKLKNLKRVVVDAMGQDMQDKLHAINPQLDIIIYSNRNYESNSY